MKELDLSLDVLKTKGLVICDMDGLLLDTEALSYKSFVRCSADFNLPVNADLFAELTGRSGPEHRQIFSRYLGERGLDFDLRWKQIYACYLDKDVPVKNNAKKILSVLSQEGYRLALATSSHSEKAREQLMRAGLYRYFSLIKGGDEVASAKPAPDIYLAVMAEQGVIGAHSLILEDSNHGVRAGLAAGGHVIQIPDMLPASPEFLPHPRYLLKDSLAEVINLFV